MDIKLSKPLVTKPAEGNSPEQAIGVLTLKLDNLTGEDVEIAAREADLAGSGVPIVERRLDLGFQAHLAARAAGINIADLRRLASTDYFKVTAAVRDFLLSSD